MRAIAVPLACGNAVILKASEICPLAHTLIIEAFAEGGFPEGVVQIVTNAPQDASDIVGTLIDAPAVKRINFTGSTAVGRLIATRAAGHVKPCLLELGGKAPLLVLHDADLRIIVVGAMVDAKKAATAAGSEVEALVPGLGQAHMEVDSPARPRPCVRA